MQKRWASGHWLLRFLWQLRRLFWKAVDSSWNLWSLFLNELCSMYKYFLYFCSYYNSKVFLCFFNGNIFNPARKLCLCLKESHCKLLIYWLCSGVAVKGGQHVMGVSSLHPLSWSCANDRPGIGWDSFSGMWKQQSPAWVLYLPPTVAPILKASDIATLKQEQGGD